jgi:hypothetical protein
MRLTILFILLLGAFLGGYYSGQQPNSPDVFGWAQGAYESVCDLSDQIAEAGQHATEGVTQDHPADAPDNRQNP